MGIKRFFKNKIKYYKFINKKRQLIVNVLEPQNFELKNWESIQSNLPEVTLIISNFRNKQNLFTCLDSISKHDTKIPKEVILVNDTEESISLQGLKIINTDKTNLVKNVNHAIQEAKGKFIYFIDANTQVHEGFLSNLISVFETKKNSVAVESKLVSKNQMILNFNPQKALDQPEYNYLQKILITKGQSVLIKKENALQSLFLDDSYKSVEFALKDFCLQQEKKQIGYTYYQPYSEISLLENENSISKEDEILFKEKWGGYIPNNPYKKSSILFLEENMPKPDQDSGSRRFFEIVKILIEKKHHLILAVKHYNEETDREYVDFFRKYGVEVCVDFVNAKNKIEKVNQQVLESIKRVDIIWIFRPLGFDYWYSLIKNNIQNKKLVYDMVDLHYLRMERENAYIDITENRKKETAFFKEKEYFGMSTADAVVSISDEEKKIVSEQGITNEKIFSVSNIHTSVDFLPLPFNKRDGLLFIGGYRHIPNIDAVKFLFEDIMPKVWEKEPTIKVYILGPDFPEDMKKQYHSERFQILGYQESVDYWFENSRVFVAPLRYGAGVKGKIGQALEFKLPVVTTEIGAEGMGLEDEVTSLISDQNPSNFAAQILKLYHEEILWNTVHQNSHLPLSRFSIETQKTNIENLFKYLGLNN